MHSPGTCLLAASREQLLQRLSQAKAFTPVSMHPPYGARAYAATREQLLQRLRHAKAQELLDAQPPPLRSFWRDRRTWLLLMGGIAAGGWAYR